MSEPTNADLHRTLGVIEAKVEGLRAEFNRERDGAQSHRQSLRETITALAQAVRDLTGQLTALNGDLAEIKPLVNDYRENRDQARGAAKLGRWLYGAFIAVAAVAGVIVNEVWKWLGKHP